MVILPPQWPTYFFTIIASPSCEYRQETRWFLGLENVNFVVRFEYIDVLRNRSFLGKDRAGVAGSLCAHVKEVLGGDLSCEKSTRAGVKRLRGMRGIGSASGAADDLSEYDSALHYRGVSRRIRRRHNKGTLNFAPEHAKSNETKRDVDNWTRIGLAVYGTRKKIKK